MTLTRGTRLGSYEILSPLGAGGMGEVYLAEDTRLDRKIALKLLPAEFTKDENRVRRFVQEAKAASALNHPNIVTIHEIGDADGTRFIATEFIDGETLRGHMHRERLTVRQAADIATQVAGALAAAHKAGIVHRDIKPENIMLRNDGIVKVLDFGLAKLTDRQGSAVDTEAATRAKLTDPGSVMGTASYMSPEQARGQQVDARTDLFSLGVVVYEMIAARPPFGGVNSLDVISAILQKEPAPLSQHVSDLPADLQRIVGKTLRKDRDQRYQTAIELFNDLTDVKEELSFTAKRTHSGQTERDTITAPTDAASTSQVTPAGTTTGVDYLVNSFKAHKLVALSALVIALATAGYFFFGRGADVSINSIAVLPFLNSSEDPNADYLSDGIAESLMNSLSHLPNLKVMSRNSAFRYKGKEQDAQKVGSELNVRAVLQGNVKQVGNQLVISVSLDDARDNHQIWGEKYNRKLSDILIVQDDVARQISDRLRIKLTGEEKGRVTKRYTDNVEAYQLYLRGRYEWNKFDAEGFMKSIDYFNHAIQIDAAYAPAYSGLADSFVNLGIDYLPPKETLPKAKEAATRALALDDTLAEAHNSLASYKLFYEWDGPAAEREYRRAIELDPNYATAHHFYSHCLQFTGRSEEALREMKRSVELDPLSLVNNEELGWSYYLARQYDAAIEQLRKTIELDPSFVVDYFSLAETYEAKGLYKEAIAELTKARGLAPGWLELSAELAYTYAASGNKADARKLLNELLKRAESEHVNAAPIATVYGKLGDMDQAFVWMEKAFAQRSSWLPSLSVEPKFDSLRQDPRFADLERRMNLTQ